jgi:DNA-directed RNA polymerase beta subunit
MSNNQHVRERQRLDFAKIQGSIQIPNLIEVQMKSYQRFLQMDLLPSERDDAGLQSVFTSVFPIKDFREMSQLEFVDYAIGNWECKCGNLKGLHHLRATCRNCGASVVTNPYQTGDVICHKCGTFNKNTPTFCNKCGDPVAMQLKYDVNECQERGMTYSAPLKVTIRLTIYDKDPDSGAKTIRDIKEQEVFYGDIPLMTENGTFIINGTERVIVSQLHRSPGVFFESANNRSYFLGKIIPYRGSWVEFEYDTKNILYVRIDRKRKFLGSIFLRALGMKSNEDILRTFYQVERISLRDKDLYWNVSPGLLDRKLTHEIKNPRSEDVIVGAHKRITENLFKELIKAKVSQVRAALADLEGAYSVADVVNRQTGEVLLEANKPLTADVWQAFAEAGITEVDIFFPERDDIGLVLSRTLDKDGIRSSKEALIEIYRKLRPGRSADARNRHELVPRHVLRSAQVRFQPRRPAQVQHQDGSGHAAGQSHAGYAGLRLRHQISFQAAQEHRRGRRHRPSRQPPRARGGRIARKSVSHRLGPYGTRHQGKDERVPGNVHRHATRLGQRQAGNGCDSRILREFAAQPVHGPDQPAQRDHAQAASFGSWARRSLARTRGIRSARRASHALRPHLPD